MKYFLIAGEPSGDLLGGKLIRSLREKDPEAEFYGIGGEQMAAAGLSSIIPMSELTVMGLWEVAMRLPQLLKLRKGLVEEIEAVKPDAVITIDFPDFNFAVIKLLKKRNKIKTKAIHYVAPTVWAWRPGRAEDVAEYLDAIMCLFPFEPDYFKKHKLRAAYVGHPITDGDIATGSRERFRQKNQVPDDAKLLGLYFGSRHEELHNVGRVIRETAQYVKEQVENVELIVPTLDGLEYDVVQLLQGIGMPAYITSDFGTKYDAIAATDVAICVSGTVALQLAYAGVPHVVVYKTSPVTFWLVRLLAKVKFVHLGNIILNRKVVPEFLQGRCVSELVSDEVVKLFNDPEAAAEQKKGFEDMKLKLDMQGKETPSERAARYILTVIHPPAKPDTGKKMPATAKTSPQKQAAPVKKKPAVKIKDLKKSKDLKRKDAPKPAREVQTAGDAAQKNPKNAA